MGRYGNGLLCRLICGGDGESRAPKGRYSRIGRQPAIAQRRRSTRHWRLVIGRLGLIVVGSSPVVAVVVDRLRFNPFPRLGPVDIDLIRTKRSGVSPLAKGYMYVAKRGEASDPAIDLERELPEVASYIPRLPRASALATRFVHNF
jgi:hypothetical protein